MLLLAATLLARHALVPFIPRAQAADAASTAKKPETVDIGIIKNSDIKVVQRRLYSKEHTLELGLAIGALPWDTFTFAPKLQLTGTSFLSETLGLEAHVGGGYGLETTTYKYLAGADYGVAVEAYRYLADAQVGVHYSPIYAKMNFGNKIVHNDWYGLACGGATLEQSVLPAADIAIAPTLGLGIGTQIWLGKTLALRTELRDDLMLEHRKQSNTEGFKQNAGIIVGIGTFSGGKK